MSRKSVFIIAPNFYGIDRAIREAFKTLGFHAILENGRVKLNPAEKVARRMAKRGILADFANGVVKRYLQKDNDRYVSMIEKARPDMLFVVKGETILPKTLAEIKNKLKIPCVAYLWDCPFFSYTGSSTDIYRRNNFANGMGLYDRIFVYDPYYVREIAKRGVSNASYVPLATDPELYKAVGLTKEEESALGFDVAFVGSPIDNRVDILDSLAEFNLGVFGDGWAKYFAAKMRRPPAYYKGRATGEKVLKIYAAAKIVLNIHGTQRGEEGLNTRTFDIPACRAFELVDFKKELTSLFRAGEEIVYYNGIDDLKKNIRYYLDNPELRQRIAEKSRARVLSSHTWFHRVRDMMKVLQEEKIFQEGSA